MTVLLKLGSNCKSLSISKDLVRNKFVSRYPNIISYITTISDVLPGDVLSSSIGLTLVEKV